MLAWAREDPVLARLRLPDHPPVSIVGGAVRDALLGAPHGPDIDLVVEGDAVSLARRLGRELGAQVVAHPRFGTAELELELPHGRRLDLVSARRERYPAPGALPVVAPGTIDDDLGRRDFAINAMAFRLSGPGAGELLDPHDGRGDLAARRVRALRAGAFAEDPSRLLRAARYAARLGFTVEPATAVQARAAAAGAHPASARVADELRRLLDEERAAEALELAHGLGVPWMAGERVAGLRERFTALDRALAVRGAPPLPAWALRLGLALGPHAAGAALPGWARGLAAEADSGAVLAVRLAAPGLAPSGVDRLLRPAPQAAAAAALAAGAGVVERWWGEWRDLVPAVAGADLIAAGVAPGPGIGRALAAVRAAVIDGAVGGRDDQLALALRVAGAAP